MAIKIKNKKSHDAKQSSVTIISCWGVEAVLNSVMMLISKSSWCIFVKLPSLLDGWCLQNSEKILTFNHQMKAEHIIHHSGVFLVQNFCLNISCLSAV